MQRTLLFISLLFAGSIYGQDLSAYQSGIVTNGKDMAVRHATLDSINILLAYRPSSRAESRTYKREIDTSWIKDVF